MSSKEIDSSYSFYILVSVGKDLHFCVCINTLAGRFVSVLTFEYSELIFQAPLSAEISFISFREDFGSPWQPRLWGFYSPELA